MNYSFCPGGHIFVFILDCYTACLRCPFHNRDTGMSTIWKIIRHWFHRNLSKYYWHWRTLLTFHQNNCIVVLACFYSWNIIMSLCDNAVTSHELHGVWTHQHFDCLFNNLYSLTIKIWKSSITCGEPGCDWFIISFAWINWTIVQ